MTKRFFLRACLQAFSLLFLFSNVKAQVYNGDLILNSQAQVDAFNYTSVTGSLRVLSAGITNVNGLSELTTVGSDFYIASTAVSNVNPLSNLVSVGKSLAITNNNALANVDGLSNLTFIGEHLSFHDDISLTNVNGLSKLTSIGGGVTLSGNRMLTNIDLFSGFTTLDFLIIDHNNALANLNGFSNLTSIAGMLQIESNPALVDLSGLSKLKSVSRQMEISFNTNLTNVDGLSALTSVGKGLAIEFNSRLTNVDGFSHLTSLHDSLKITSNQSLTNLNGFSGLTSLDGSLIITNNPKLSDINGLVNIKNVGGRLEIISNAILTNMDGLSNVELVGGSFGILSNPLLTNLDGLSKLKKVEGHLTISGNNALTSIDGLSNLTRVEGNLGMNGNNVLTNLDGFVNLTYVGLDLGIIFHPALVDFCGLYKLFNVGTIGRDIRITDNGANTVDITPPANITVNADPGVCSATLLQGTIGTATPVGCLVPFTTPQANLPAGNIFTVGITQITWNTTDGAGNTATAVQTITVVDNQPPVITCPGAITVSCASDVPAVNTASVTATDNCSATVEHVSDVVSNQTCVNRFTLTRTYKATDPAGNSTNCSQVITVYDNIPPQLSTVIPSQSALWPPNHTMRDITLNYSVTDNCVINPNTTVSIQSNEPVNGTADGDTDPDWEIIDNHHIRLRAERAANGNGRVYTITITVNDGCNPSVTGSAQVMVTHNITGPVTGKPFKIGSTVDFAGEFWDKPTNTHSGKWLIDNTTSIKGIVAEPTSTKNGKATGSYKFSNAGVYKLQMNIIDQNGITSYANTNGDVDAIVVIYDPNGGYAYGGGWFNSPAGALTSNSSATGKASYGFTVNYFKNSALPKGETQFEFKVGEFEFNAVNFDYLSVSGAKAQIKGSGKIIGGQSGINFIMTVVDGHLDGSGIDKLRMKIYNKNTGFLYYDNQPEASDAAMPITAVGLNSTIVIGGNQPAVITQNSNKTTLESATDVSAENLELNVYPNPSTTGFIVRVNSNYKNMPVSLTVSDQYGRVVECRTGIIAGSTIRLGAQYRTGSYFISVMQGRSRKEIKLVKL